MAATAQLWRGVARCLVMSAGDRSCGQVLGVHGIHRRVFSSPGGTPADGLEAPNNYNLHYNYKPPEQYNEDYCYKPPHYNNPIDGYSSRDKCFKNISEKPSYIKMDYHFEKLEYQIFNMERDFEKHYEKFHRALQEWADEIRDERKKAVLHINTEKLSNDLKTVIHSNMNKLTNDLINVYAKHVLESKAAVDDPTIVCAKSVAESKAALAKSKAAVKDDDDANDLMIGVAVLMTLIFTSWFWIYFLT